MNRHPKVKLDWKKTLSELGLIATAIVAMNFINMIQEYNSPTIIALGFVGFCLVIALVMLRNVKEIK